MKKFVGELRNFVDPVFIVYDSTSTESNVHVIGSILRIFDPFLHLRFLDSNSPRFASRLKTILRTKKILMSTDHKCTSLIQNTKNLGSCWIIGFFVDLSIFSETEISNLCAVYNRIVTIPDRQNRNYKAETAANRIEFVNLALDLRRFYNLEKKGSVDFLHLGVICKESNIRTLISNKTKINQFLRSGPQFRLHIFEESLSTASHELLCLNFTEQQICISENEFSLKAQLEFFSSIDYLIKPSNSISDKVTAIESEASAVCVIDLDGLLDEKQFLRPRESPSINDNVHPNDFRLLKFEYLKAFFGIAESPLISQDLIVVPSDAGFFSVFNTLISIRAHWLGIHGFSSIEPDWSVKGVLDFWNTKSLTSYCYAGMQEGNVFFRLFQNNKSQPSFSLDAGKSNPKKKSLPLLAHSPNLSADPDFTYVFADRLYRSAGFQVWRNEMNKALNNLQPNVQILDQVEDLFSNVPPNALILGMHVRHPSHAMEQPNSEIPQVGDFLEVAQNLIDENSENFEHIRIFLATDQDEVVDAFRSTFADSLLYFENVTRVSLEQSATFHKLDKNQKMQLGNQVQHIAAQDSSRWSSLLAEEIIRDAWALAKCNKLIHAVSNVATAVTYLNPELESIPIMRGDNLKLARARNFLGRITSLI
jgi:hypothetical protein